MALHRKQDFTMSLLPISWHFAFIIVCTCASFFLPWVEANLGNTFIVPLPYTKQSDTFATIYMIPFNSSATNISWSPQKDSSPKTETFVPRDNSQVYFINWGLNTAATVGYIQAQPQISVIVNIVTTKNQQVFSLGTYLNCPVTELSTSYVAVTECPQVNCFIIVASPSDNVSIVITLVITPSIATLVYNGEKFQNGGTITASLNARQMLQIDAGKSDLTGTRINSSSPIVVLAGGDFVQNGSDTEDMIVDLMPTPDLTGTRYAVVAFPNSTLTTFLKIIYFVASSEVNFEPPELSLISEYNNYRYYNFTPSSKGAVLITSDNKIIVEFISRSTVIASGDTGVLLIPMDKWAARYVTVMRYGDISLVTNQSCRNSILLNGKIVAQNWTPIGKTSYMFTNLKLTDSNIKSVVLESNGGCTFGGYLQYKENQAITMFPLGWSQLSVPSETLPASSVATSTLAIYPYPVHVSENLISLEHTSSVDTSELHYLSPTFSLAMSPEATSLVYGTDLKFSSLTSSFVLLPSRRLLSPAARFTGIKLITMSMSSTVAIESSLALITSDLHQLSTSESSAMPLLLSVGIESSIALITTDLHQLSTFKSSAMPLSSSVGIESSLALITSDLHQLSTVKSSAMPLSSSLGIESSLASITSDLHQLSTVKSRSMPLSSSLGIESSLASITSDLHQLSTVKSRSMPLSSSVGIESSLASITSDLHQISTFKSRSMPLSSSIGIESSLALITSDLHQLSTFKSSAMSLSLSIGIERSLASITTDLHQLSTFRASAMSVSSSVGIESSLAYITSDLHHLSTSEIRTSSQISSTINGYVSSTAEIDGQDRAPTTPYFREHTTSTQSNRAGIVKQCPCSCTANKTLMRLSRDSTHFQKVTGSITRELHTVKSDLSSSKRTKLSSQNIQPSAAILGSTLGLVLVIFFVVVIIAPDVISLGRYLISPIFKNTNHVLNAREATMAETREKRKTDKQN